MILTASREAERSQRGAAPSLIEDTQGQAGQELNTGGGLTFRDARRQISVSFSHPASTVSFPPVFVRFGPGGGGRGTGGGAIKGSEGRGGHRARVALIWTSRHPGEGLHGQAGRAGSRTDGSAGAISCCRIWTQTEEEEENSENRKKKSPQHFVFKIIF